jgi:hypothetical protein
MQTTGPADTGLDRTRRARDALAARLLGHPAVSLVDIGLDPYAPQSLIPVVRVHLHRQASRENLNIPAEVDGVPVRLVTGDYRLE